MLAGAAALLALLRDLDTVTVRGRSMEPTLLPGDRLLVRRLRRPPRVGEMVLAPDPLDGGRELVKRVAAVGPEGVALLGDHAAHSTDARTFGTVAIAEVRWGVVLRYRTTHG